MIQANDNLYQHFQRQFDGAGDKPALVLADKSSITYADLTSESARLARYLTDLGIQVGDRVSVQVAKSPSALYLYLACLRAGFVFHPLNTGYKDAELDYFLSDAEPALVVCENCDQQRMAMLCQKNSVGHLLTLNADGSGSISDGAEQTAAEFGVIERTDHDLAALLYSSGTTGVPKGIMLSHLNLRSNAECLVEAWGFSQDDVLLHALPIFHVHGLFVALGCAFLSGASMHWLTDFDVQQVLQQLPNCSVMMGVPTYYTRLLASDQFDRALTSHMRLFISGSAPLLAETFEQFSNRTGQSILERYGMTETNMNTSNPLVGERRAGTVGLPLPGVEVRIVNAEGAPVDDGEIGDIQVRGENVFQGYWRMPKKTAEDLADDGFFTTGDKGTQCERGYVSIVGRAKDMVISGGLNVYPKEVELVIDSLDGIRESAVIGIAHADFGEAVVAVVIYHDGQAQPDEAAIIAALKAQIAGFKVPKKVISIEQLPRNTMGKVQKNLLRERFSDLFKST
jgi:malonyl-CoA/methylmalonyl-CoA synthetase